jgi:hypothetical protein
MKRFAAPAALIAIVASGAIVTLAGAERELSPQWIPGAAGIHWAREVRPPRGAHAAAAAGSPNLLYNGGPVMTKGAYVEPIFWGTTWNSPGDKISGIETFYKGFGASPYEGTNTEYADASGRQVGSAVTFGGSHLDRSVAPRSGNRTSTILAEVCRAATVLRSDGYYPVYVDSPRRNAGYCAWHSAGSCGNGTTVQFAFFFKLDGDAGCDPQDTSDLHSEGLAALANVSGHELSEALTDPHLDAWYDAAGEENADKCAWSFGTPLLTFANGSKWKIQGNWSNAAYNAGTGYANRDGQRGCIDGGNFR